MDDLKYNAALSSAINMAINMAVNAHHGQFDKGGAPYILHPLRLMLLFDTEAEQIAAVLHDVVEDGGIPLGTISRLFGSEIANAVNALTRRDGESYMAFIDRCCADELACKIKRADLCDNMNTGRLPKPLTKGDLDRLSKYRAALDRINQAIMRRFTPPTTERTA